jgi:23S rRNA pseudouridine1911/1915/1917 synthase
MIRILKYKITKNDQGKAIRDFLREQRYSRKVITFLKEAPSKILLNGESVSVRTLLCENDKLEVLLSEQKASENIVPEAGKLEIIYEDEDILVVNKPPGMPVHPSVNHHFGTLANYVAGYYDKQGIPYVFRCMNRLDRDTSGLVLLAKNMLSGAILSKDLKDCGLHREYRAIVCGQLPQSGRITVPIGRKPGSVIERMVDFEHGQEAVTNYRRLDYQNGYSYVSIWLETGRTHQIRVHMKHIGHPLPGDFLYHPDMSRIKRQPLHSYRLCLIHPITRQEMEFTALLPEDMKSMIE